MGEVDNDTIFLFVYGTLRRGEPGHGLMAGAAYVATAAVGHLRWVPDAEYPACVESGDDADSVTGEIWAVPVKDLPLLDDYEGENYRRVQLRDSNLYAYLLKEDEADEFVEIP